MIDGLVAGRWFWSAGAKRSADTALDPPGPVAGIFALQSGLIGASRIQSAVGVRFAHLAKSMIDGLAAGKYFWSAVAKRSADAALDPHEPVAGIFAVQSGLIGASRIQSAVGVRFAHLAKSIIDGLVAWKWFWSAGAKRSADAALDPHEPVAGIFAVQSGLIGASRIQSAVGVRPSLGRRTPYPSRC